MGFSLKGIQHKSREQVKEKFKTEESSMQEESNKTMPIWRKKCFKANFRGEANITLVVGKSLIP